MRIDGSETDYLHQTRILMVMNPRDQHSQNKDFADREPDLVLTFDIYSFERNRIVIENLKRGDYIKFNATITQLGSKRIGDSLTKNHAHDEDSVQHIHALDMAKIRSDGPQSVGEHIHWDGRF